MRVRFPLRAQLLLTYVIFFVILLLAMEIRYLGHASFLIKTKEAVLVTDPYDQSIGFPFPKIEADIVSVSHQHKDHNNFKAVGGNPLIIDTPGEFEKNNIRVFGYKWYHDAKKGEERGENILYKIEVEDLTLLHCGDLGALPNDQLLEEIGNVDVLFVPTGGFYTIDAATASSLIKEIDPKVVIPMHYNHKQLNQETFAKLSPVDDFLKEMGVDMSQPLEKLTLKKESLGEEMKVVVMKI